MNVEEIACRLFGVTLVGATKLVHSFVLVFVQSITKRLGYFILEAVAHLRRTPLSAHQWRKYNDVCALLVEQVAAHRS